MTWSGLQCRRSALGHVWSHPPKPVPVPADPRADALTAVLVFAGFAGLIWLFRRAIGQRNRNWSERLQDEDAQDRTAPDREEP